MRLKTMMMCFVWAVIPVISGNSGFAAEKATQHIKLSSIKMGIDIPGDWQKGGISGKTILGSYKKGKTLYPNLNISLEDSSGMSLRQFHDKLVKILPKAKVNSVKEETVNNRKVLVSDIAWKSFLGELRALRLITKIENKVLVVTFVGKKSDFKKPAQQLYLKCLKSLK